jgi:hypothetical protein
LAVSTKAGTEFRFLEKMSGFLQVAAGEQQGYEEQQEREIGSASEASGLGL